MTTTIRRRMLVIATVAAALLGGLTPANAHASTTASQHSTLNSSTGFDIFIVAGQSNAAGYGAGSDQLGQTEDCVYQFTQDDEVQLASEPLDHFTSLEGRTGFAMEFSRAWRAARPHGRCILLIPAGADGTGFADGMWLPSGDAHESLIHRTNTALTQYPGSTITALFWQQGESEAKDGWSSVDYLNAFSTMMQSFEERIDSFGNDTPLLVGEMVPDWVDANPARSGVHAAHTTITEVRPSAHLVSSSLPTRLTSNEDDPLHYSAMAQLELGRRYFDVVHPLIELPEPPPAPTQHPDAVACLFALFELSDFTCVADGFRLIVVPFHPNKPDDVVVIDSPPPNIRIPFSHRGIDS